MRTASIILAAGQGTRMKSKIPKVLHTVVGKPLVHHAIDIIQPLGCEKTVLVVGHCADQVQAVVGNRAEFVEQHQQLGTGHAVLQTKEILHSIVDTVIVTFADMPLIKSSTLQKMIVLHESSQATITMLTVISEDSMSFGRVLRDPNNRVVGIIEERDATPQQLGIHELNCGVFCFEANWLWDHLVRLQPSRNGEFYLTNLVAMAAIENRSVAVNVTMDATEMIGVNTPLQLALAEKIMQERLSQCQ